MNMANTVRFMVPESNNQMIFRDNLVGELGKNVLFASGYDHDGNERRRSLEY